MPPPQQPGHPPLDQMRASKTARMPLRSHRLLLAATTCPRARFANDSRRASQLLQANRRPLWSAAASRTGSSHSLPLPPQPWLYSAKWTNHNVSTNRKVSRAGTRTQFDRLHRRGGSPAVSTARRDSERRRAATCRQYRERVSRRQEYAGCRPSSVGRYPRRSRPPCWRPGSRAPMPCRRPR